MMTTSFRRAFLVLLVAAISFVFFWMISDFLMTILLAALFSGVSYGIHRRIARRLGGREKIAAAITLVLILMLVVVPMLGIAGAVANQALRVSQNIGPRLTQLSEPGTLDRWLRPLPGYTRLKPYRDQIIARVWRADWEHQRRRLQRAVGDNQSDRRLHLSLRGDAVHDVLLSDGWPAARAQHPGLPAAGRRRQTTPARQLRVGDARDPEGHRAHRAGARRPRRVGVLCRRHRRARHSGARS